MSDMDDRGLGQYDDTNRAFLQGLMARGSITSREGQKLLAAILSAKGGMYSCHNCDLATPLIGNQRRILRMDPFPRTT
jgi:hypothetical protein